MSLQFVQVLGSVTVPATEHEPARRFENVITLNTAGSNLLLFSCPNTAALMAWAAALRLSAWEKSRLEEIYTAHLIRITLPGKSHHLVSVCRNANDSTTARDIPTTLVRDRMEGWVRIRVAGQTDWKRFWMVIRAGVDGSANNQLERLASSENPPLTSNTVRKKRMSHLFSRDHSPTPPAGPMKPTITMYTSPKPKDKKKAMLTMTEVTQVFAVYPERPELISRSTLIKTEGLLGDEDTAAGMRRREGWLLIMPELEGGNDQAKEMLKWVVGEC